MDGVRAAAGHALVLAGGVDRGIGVRHMNLNRLWWPGWAVVVLTFLAMVFHFSALDPLPSAVACADTNLVYADVRVQPHRAGHMGEWDFFGCTAYWYT